MTDTKISAGIDTVSLVDLTPATPLVTDMFPYARAGDTLARKITVGNLRGGVFNVKDYGAVGDGVTNDTAAIQAALSAIPASGGEVFFPPGQYKLTTPLSLASNTRLVGAGGSNRWGINPTMTDFPVRIEYAGTVACLRIKPGAGGHLRNIKVLNLHFDGTNSTGNVDGLQIDCSDAGADFQGLVVEDTMFSNFPRSQIYQLANGAGSSGWSWTFDRVSCHDQGRTTTGNLVDFLGPASSIASVNFNNCDLMPYLSGEWALKFIGADIHLVGGNIAPMVAGANGSWTASTTTVFGTHYEGIASTGIGCRVVGVGGHYLVFGYNTLFATGVQVGDSTASGVRAAWISGFVGGNTTDVHITNGGIRQGTVISGVGANGGTLVVLDERASIDGLFDVTRIDANRLIVPTGTAAAPMIAQSNYLQTGPFVDGATGDLVWSIAGTERMRMPAASVALKLTAQLYPGSGVSAYAAQTAAGILGGTGVPNNSVGNNGDIYINSSGGAMTTIYQKQAGTWGGIL